MKLYKSKRHSKLQRFLLIMADNTKEPEEDGSRWLFATSAFVLARDQDHAMEEAADALADDAFVPTIAWPITRVEEILADLKACPLTPLRQVIFNRGSHYPEDDISGLLGDAGDLMSPNE